MQMTGKDKNMSPLVEECHWGTLCGHYSPLGWFLTQPHLVINITDISCEELPPLVHSTTNLI